MQRTGAGRGRVARAAATDHRDGTERRGGQVPHGAEATPTRVFEPTPCPMWQAAAANELSQAKATVKAHMRTAERYRVAPDESPPPPAAAHAWIGQ